MHTNYFFTLPWDFAKKRRPSEPLFTAHDAGRTPPKPRALLYSVHYGHLPRKSQLCCALKGCQSRNKWSGRNDRGWARQQPRSDAAAIDFLCQASFARSADAPFAPYVLAALQCALANREHSDPQVQLCAFETLTAAWGWIVLLPWLWWR